MVMRLNTLRPATGAKRARVRVGRGIGSGTGKTGGRGNKGQKSRSGSSRRRGFEGGQMPLQRRLPKYGFKSFTAYRSAQVTLGELDCLDVDVIDITTLRGARVIGHRIQQVKVIASGAIGRSVTLKGLRATAGARAAIEAAGGKVESSG